MADLDQQIRGYAAGLGLGAPVDPGDIVRAVPSRHRAPGGRWLFLAAAAVLVIVVLGAAVVALRDDATEEPAPTVDTTVVPQAWERIAEIDGAQPFAMAASDRGVVLVGYGAWWSADGSAWEIAGVEGIDDANSLFPASMADVVATDDGFVAVGTSAAPGDRQIAAQPAAWRSPDGRSWERVVDDDLELPTGSIPSGVSTPYGSLTSVVATDDGLVAVGSAFDGTFSGGTLVSPDPFRPAVWTSDDGTDWARVEDLPDGDGALVGATVVDGEVVAVGTAGDTSYVWRSDGDGTGWDALGQLEGTASDVAEVGGALVVAGARNADREASPTIWSSVDGSTWTVAHEEPASSIAAFTELVEDGDLLLALGYTGPGELDVDGLLLSSPDGIAWAAGPGIGDPPVTCDLAAGSGRHCPSVSSHPEAGTLLGSELLLVTTESVTTSDPTGPPTTRLRAGVLRARSVAPDPTASAAVTTELEPLSGPVPSGGSLDAFVVVHNRTGTPIEVGACDGPFRVVLANDEAQQLDAGLLCLATYVIPPGTSRWPVTILGVVNVCADAFDPDGCGPLPPGTYTATVSARGNLPAPPPVAVEVR